MTLQKQILLGRADGRDLPGPEDVLEACRNSRTLEAASEYEKAQKALSGRWGAVGQRPLMAGLDGQTAAELLLRVGVLTGHLGSSAKLNGAQERARDLLTEAREMFHAAGNEGGAFEAEAAMSVCYWREAAYDEARDLAKTVLSACNLPRCRACLTCVITCGMAYHSQGKEVAEGIDFLLRAKGLFNESDEHGLRGSYHNCLATLYKQSDDIDGALLEYMECSTQLELAGNFRYLARLENNLANMMSEGRQFAEAHAHVERARRIAIQSGDEGYVGEVETTRAGIYLKEGNYQPAVEAAQEAVKILRAGDEYGLQVEALTTLGSALALTGKTRESSTVFFDAHETASRLIGAEDARGVARKMAEALTLSVASMCGFNYDEACRLFEGSLIKAALRESNGRVTWAARRLGMASPERLNNLLEGRHKDLQNERTPIQPRRRSYTQ